jgi:DNA-binding NarL/FixJ family response regulator
LASWATAPPSAVTASDVGPEANRPPGRHIPAAAAHPVGDAVGLYGRGAERMRVAQFLDDVNIRPAALLIEGAVGIGKTTIWSDGIEQVRDRGWWVLSCRPVESEAALSFSALGDLLEPVPESAFARLPPPQRQALDVALLRAEPGPDPPDQRAVAVALLGVIRALADTAPVVIAVDDLPWLDRASAAVLQYALRRLTTQPVGLLATVTAADSGGPAAPQQWWHPQDRLECMKVGPLGIEALHAMLRAKGSAPHGWPEITEVHQASGGNPYFAIELAAALAARGRVRGVGRPLPIPASLQPLAQRRLEALPPAGREVALLAAAAANPTVPTVLAACDDEELARTGLESAEAAGVLEVDGDQVRFAHAMLRSLHYSSATELARRRAHRRLAATVAADEERVRHLALAAEGPDEQLARELDAAAWLACRRGAAVAGAELADLALALTPPGPVQARLQRLVASADLHLAAFDADRARRLLDDALSMSEPGELRASALHLLAKVTGYAEGAGAARPLLQQALSEARDGTKRKAELHRDLGFLMGISAEGFTDATMQQFWAAWDIAQRLGDQALITQLLAFEAVAEFATGCGVRRDLIERVLAAGLQAGPARPDWAAVGPRLLISHLLRSIDDLAGARSLLVQELTAAVQQGAETDLPFVIVHLAVLETWAGNIELAETYADRGYRVAQAGDAVTQLALMHGARALIRAYKGPLDEARAEAESAIDAGLRSGVLYAVLLGSQAMGLVELVSGAPAAAHARLGLITAATVGRGMIDPGWIALRTLPDDIEALIRLGDVGAAESLLAPLEERAQRLDRAWALVTAARCRALLMSAQGHHDSAAATVQRALAAHQRLEMPLELARTQLVAGEIARRARRKVAAREHIEAASVTFAAAGAAPWVQRASAELARIGTLRPGALELTSAERQVASLVAAGRTNREAAAELYMGLRTVEAHLSAIYAKLGIRSRSDLARIWAARSQSQG